MTAYLTDTNHVSRLLDPGHPFRVWFLEQVSAGDTFSLIVPLITETVFGFSILPRASRNWIEWQEVRPSLLLLPLDEKDALNAANLQVLLRRQGRQLATVDSLIAAVALRNDLTLLTTDGDFAAVPSLLSENRVT